MMKTTIHLTPSYTIEISEELRTVLKKACECDEEIKEEMEEVLNQVTISEKQLNFLLSVTHTVANWKIFETDEILTRSEIQMIKEFNEGLKIIQWHGKDVSKDVLISGFEFKWF